MCRILVGFLRDSIAQKILLNPKNLTNPNSKRKNTEGGYWLLVNSYWLLVVE
jgi:hypothetical protein